MPRTRANVEIARVGTYALSSGEHTFTREQLAAAVRNHATGAAPRLGIGHVDPRFNVEASDGDPAIGSVANLRLDESGDVLVGDFINVPDWLDDAMESAYPGRSLEGSATATDLRLRGVKLLGYTTPGIHTLADLRSFVEDGPALVAAGSDNDGHTFTVLLTAASPSTHAQEATTMDVDRTLLVRRLGLADDATDEQIAEALRAAPAERPEAEVTTTEETTTTETAETAATVTELPARPAEAATEEAPAALAAAAGEITRLSTKVAELEAREAARARTETETRRDTLIASAVREGRIAPVDRDHYRSLLDANETVGTTLIQARAKGTIPLTPVSHGEDVAASAHDALVGDDGLLPVGVSTLTAEERAAVAARRR